MTDNTVWWTQWDYLYMSKLTHKLKVFADISV